MKRLPCFLVLLLALSARPALSAAEFHVSPKGADANIGSATKPFATLERAREAARAARRAKPDEPVTVWIHAGDYQFGRSFALGAEDSGTAQAPTTYRAMDGETVRLVGSRRLKAKDFQAITDPATLARVAEPARGHLLAVDLAALKVNRAKRYPDMFNDTGGIVDLFIDGRRQPLARFPNEGYMTMKRVTYNAGGPTGPASNSDPNWGAIADPNRGGVFEYREEFAAKHALWAGLIDRGVWLKGYWRIPWQNEAVRIAAIDTAAGTVTQAKPVPGGIGNKYTRPFGNGQEKYWAFNLLEEIDMPGEWCVDFTDQKLYLWPPAIGKGADVFLADNTEPVIKVEGASHVVLRGLTVEATLGDGIRVRGGEQVLVAGCTVRNLDRYAIRFDGGVRHAALSNDLYNLGEGGVWLGGGDEKADPRVPAGHRVVNNHIHHFSELVRIYTPAVNAGFTGGGGGGHHQAVGMYVAHNLIHDTPHAGVLFGSWDSVFEFNEVFRYCTVSNDVGAFYSYDRADRMGGHTFRYNLMHSTADGDGIYFDHDHRDMTVFGNIAYFKSGSGKRGTGFLYKIGTQDKSTYHIDCRNNLAIQTNYGFVFVSSRPGEARIENNVTVAVKTAWLWREVKNSKEIKLEQGYASGVNMDYESDPGFVDLARHDFRLKPDARVFRDLPGFQPIPVEQIGLFVDEYRKRLPSDDEVDRFNRLPHETSLGYDVLDRK